MLTILTGWPVLVAGLMLASGTVMRAADRRVATSSDGPVSASFARSFATPAVRVGTSVVSAAAFAITPMLRDLTGQKFSVVTYFDGNRLTQTSVDYIAFGRWSA